MIEYKSDPGGGGATRSLLGGAGISVVRVSDDASLVITDRYTEESWSAKGLGK